MEQNSLANKSSLLILEGQIRECFGRVVYSHKTHEKCSDILLSRLSIIKWSQIILSALTTGGFISIFLGTEKIGAGVGTLLSTILLILNAYVKNDDLGEIAQKHKQAANSLWYIREKYLSLLSDLAIGSKSINELQKSRDDILSELHAVYVGSPSTGSKAYNKARNALKNKEDLTFSDKEIDAFLPSELKRS